jgi:mannose-1-phosphate guanylyltransferase
VDKSAVMAVLPADHIVEREDLFRDALASAAAAAVDLGSLVVFGVEPDRPATGYGYIKAGEMLDGKEKFFRVEKFFEKPGISEAKKFCSSGLCSWNSGMFVWTYPAVMDEIRKHMPRLHEGLLKIESDPGAAGDVYSSLPPVSVDYGLMEKTSNAVMMRVRFGWNDVGSWDALETAVEKDLNGNVVMAENFKALDSSDNVIVSDGTLVAALGVKDLVIAVEDGAVLVCRKDRAQDVKKMVSELKKDGKLKKFIL